MWELRENLTGCDVGYGAAADVDLLTRDSALRPASDDPFRVPWLSVRWRCAAATTVAWPAVTQRAHDVDKMPNLRFGGGQFIRVVVACPAESSPPDLRGVGILVAQEDPDADEP